jgi:hypothetical protein
MESSLVSLKLGRAAEATPFVVRMFDRLLEASKGVLHQQFFEANVKFLTRAGSYGLLAAAALGFLYAATVAIKADALSPFLYGLGWILAVLLVLYVASQFAGSGEQLLKSAPSQLSSLAFLNSFSLLALISGWLLLLGFLFLAINTEHLPFLWMGLGGFVVCEYLAAIAMNPGLVNLVIHPRISPGEEALGILAFLLKALLRLVPIGFGAGVVIGTLAMLFQYVNFLIKGWQPLVALQVASDPANLILSAGLLPLTGYVGFLICYLVINVVRAILAVPVKLDGLARQLPPVAGATSVRE